MKKSVGSKNRLLVGTTLLFVILGMLISCSKSTMYDTSLGNNMGNKGGSTPGANEVWIQDMAFNPFSIKVPAGTTILWTNKDGVTHTVTSDKGLFDSGAISPSGTWSHLFSTAGTFTYKCAIHPNMTGSVVVN